MRMEAERDQRAGPTARSGRGWQGPSHSRRWRGVGGTLWPLTSDSGLQG